jgi:hypothetical protein
VVEIKRSSRSVNAGHLAVGELRYGFDTGQAVPDFNQPHVIRPNQVSELLFGTEHAPRLVSLAALREAWTVMLLSVSIVNVFM